jgi:hypothetical protein
MMEGKGQSIRENSGNRDQARPGEGRASQCVHGTYKHTRAGSKGSMEMDGDGSGHGSGQWAWLALALAD